MNKWCVVALLIGLLSCGKDDAPVTTDVDVTVAAWLDSAGIIANRDASGVYYYALTENPAGTPVSAGNVVSIFYHLWDLDSNLIASHQSSNGDSLQLKQGASAVYPVGLDIGLGFMRQGEVFRLILPPSQAYADLTSGAIDPDLIAMLDVEVVSIQDEASVFTQELTDIDDYIIAQSLNDTVANPVDSVELFTSGVAYKRVDIGNGPLPLNGDTIIINYTGRFLDNSTFDSRSGFEYVFGSGFPRPLIQGLDFGISLMQRGEESLLLIPSSQAYIESAQVIPRSIINDLIADEIVPEYTARIPPYSTLIFEVTRVN